MKKYETRTKTYDDKVLVLKICDWCGMTLQTETETSDKNISDEMFDSEMFWLEYVEREEGNHIDGWEVEDLCLDCVEKVRILLVDAGVTISVTEPDAQETT